MNAQPAFTHPIEGPAVLTPRGTAVLAILRAQELVPDLDAADRECVARYVADLLVVLCTDIAAPTSTR